MSVILIFNFIRDFIKFFSGADLNQMSWLLKTVAIELKVTAAHQQLSQFTSLVNLLVSVGSNNDIGGDVEMPTAPVLASQLTSIFNNTTNGRLNLLNLLFFY